LLQIFGDFSFRRNDRKEFKGSEKLFYTNLAASFRRGPSLPFRMTLKKLKEKSSCFLQTLLQTFGDLSNRRDDR
jgi:hypothetical protein